MAYKKRREFKQEFFKVLEEQQIQYCVLRNREALEKEKANSEIDILIRKEDFPTLKEIIEERDDCREIGFKPDTTHPLLVQVVGEDFELKLDFQYRGIGFCGTSVIGEELLEERIKKNDVYVLEEKAYFLHLFTHSFLYHGEFGKYSEELSELAAKDENREALKKFYDDGEKYLELIEQGEFEELLRYRNTYITKTLLNNPGQIPDIAASLTLRAGNKFGVWKAIRVLNPARKAPLLSFTGLDKSGKSTLSEFTAEEIQRWNYKADTVDASIFRHHPPLSWINKTRKKASGEASEDSSYDEKVQKEMDSFSHLEAAFRLTNATITSLKIWKERQKGNWVVTDRYPWDMALFTSTPPLWETLMKHIIPKPDIPFHVKVSEETLEERNCELSPESREKIKERVEDRKEEYQLVEIENEELEKAEEIIRDKTLSLIHNNKLKY